ncbi:helix-turn-helix domain-containing protein [Magnetococcus marinus]|uniref:helix-turn-helix domain-containing protein n=1 Tax=Magnetococcus marinus TaxID=1124597 RepID=UPI0009D6B6DE
MEFVKQQACIQFGLRLRELRQSKGFSQDAFSKHSGLHRTYIGGIERGERNPTLTTILKISYALSIHPSILFK